MPPLNYSKWDNIDDSDDEEQPAPQPPVSGKAVSSPGSSNEEKQTATVVAGFIVKTACLTTGVPLFINICASTSVPGGGMSATPTSIDGLAANFPYICGDMRMDNDGAGDCFVVECIFHPSTLARAEAEKLTAQSVIKTALAVVSQKSRPVKEDEWALFAPDELKEPTGAHFFAPGKLAAAIE